MGAGISATSAFAAGETMAFGPTATSATILDLNPTAGSGGAATYGLKVTGTTSADPLVLSVLSGPTGGALTYERVPGSVAPTTGGASFVATPTALVNAQTVPLLASGTSGSTTLTLARASGSGTDIPTVNPNGKIIKIGSGATAQYAAVASGGTTATLTLDRPLTATVSGAAIVDLGTPVWTGVTTGAAAAITVSGTSGSTTLTLTGTSGQALGGLLVRIGTGATVQYAVVSVDGGGTVTLDRPLTADVAGGTSFDRFGAVAPTSTVLTNGSAVDIQVTGTQGSPTVTLTKASGAGDNFPTVADLVNRFVKIGSGSTAQYAAVLTGGVNATTLTLDRPLTAAVTSVAFADMGALGGVPGARFTPVAVASNVAVNAYANGDSIYFGAQVPGTYTFRLFKDHNANNLYDASQDDSTPVFTMTVKDVTNQTSTDATDDWSPTITVPASMSVGQAVPATISMGGLTTSDARGLNGVTGIDQLGEGIAGTMTVGFAQTAGITNAPAVPTFDGTNIVKSSSVTSSTTNPVVVTITGAAATSVTRSVTITSNSVATVTSGATDVVGSAKLVGAAEAVKTGVATVAYTATVTVSSGDLSGKTVYFTLTPGTNTPALTADGTLISNTSGTKVYTAVTNASGVATLNVTSGTTTAGTTYTVQPSSNAQSGTLLTATYSAAKPSTFTLTTPSANMSPTVGGSVAVAGTLNDQFGATYQPAASVTQQVTVTVDQNASSYSSADVTGYATISGGAFTYTYTPTTAANAGRQDIVRFAYNDGVNPAATNLDSSVYWTSATAPSGVTITAPVAAASVTQQTATAAPIAGTAVTGLVVDSTNAGMAYKSVTLTGTPGVYFSTVASPAAVVTTDNLVTSLTVAANSSGAYTGYAFFTKAGAATITATSGTATTTVNVVVSQSSDPWTVTATGGSVEPGGTSVVTGTVVNGWGHPVSGAVVNLSLGASTIASLGSSSVTTNGDGVWSTTVTGASSGSGTATLTATNNGQAANKTANAAWLTNTGLTIAAGVFQATATVTLDPSINETTITGPTSRVGAGYVTLSGTAKPSTSVEIYGKATASSAAYGLVGLVTSEADGSWSATQYVSVTSTFFAKTSASTSSTITVTVTSATPTPAPSRVTVSLRATATGRGHVQLAADGGPVGRGTLKFYRQTSSGWTLLRTVRANVRGDATIVVTSPRGNQTFRVVYSVTGRGSASANKAVRVR